MVNWFESPGWWPPTTRLSTTDSTANIAGMNCHIRPSRASTQQKLLDILRLLFDAFTWRLKKVSSRDRKFQLVKNRVARPDRDARHCCTTTLTCLCQVLPEGLIWQNLTRSFFPTIGGIYMQSIHAHICLGNKRHTNINRVVRHLCLQLVHEM